MTSPGQSPSETISLILKTLQVTAWIGFGIFSAIAVACLALEPFVDPKGGSESLVALTALQYLSGVSLNTLPVLIAFALIKPLTDRLLGAQLRQLEAAQTEQRQEAINGLISAQVKYLETRLDGFERVISTRFPIDDFVPSFYDLDWEKLFDGAVHAEIAAFYWSKEWLDHNLSIFRSAANAGCAITMYLPHPTEYRSEYMVLADPAKHLPDRVYETAAAFLRYDPAGKIAVRLVSRSINYMCARFTYRSGKVSFIYSPFRHTEAPITGRPPVIAIDANRSGEQLRAFVEAEFLHLGKSTPLVNPESEKYVTWSDDNSRVVISSSLSCPAPCAHCYVPSLRDGSEVEAADRSVLGHFLAHSVFHSDRFHRGENGTVIFLGGMSDPFIAKNCLVTFGIIEALRSLKCDNPIHVATRYGIPQGFRERLDGLRRVLINFSLSTIESDLEFPVKKIEERFDQAASLVAKGHSVALYLRPVIPRLTKAELPKIIERCKASGIRHVTVGGLYVDDAIFSRFKDRGLNLSIAKRKIESKRMILDKKSALKKIQNEEIEDVKKELEDSDLEVFDSSFEIAKHFNRIWNDADRSLRAADSPAG